MGVEGKGEGESLPAGGCSNISMETFGLTKDSFQVLGLLEFPPSFLY